MAHVRTEVEQPIIIGGHLSQPPRITSHKEFQGVSTDPERTDHTLRAFNESYNPMTKKVIGQLPYSVDMFPTTYFDIGRIDKGVQQKYKEHLQRFGVGAPALHALLPDIPNVDKYIIIKAGRNFFKDVTSMYPYWFWPAETALDLDSLKAIRSAGYGGIICAPNQVKLDDGRPSENQLVTIRLSQNKSIVALVYDSDFSQQLSFGELHNADDFAHNHIPQALERNPRLLTAWTDFERFGHHWHGGEKFMQWFLEHSLRQPISINGHFVIPRILSINQLNTKLQDPKFIATLPTGRIYDRSSWSCHHGDLARWHGKCDCSGSKHEQRWKEPLWNTFSWLNSEITKITEHYLGPDFINEIVNDFFPLFYNPGPSDRRNTPKKSLQSAKATAIAALISDPGFFQNPHTSGRISLLFGEVAIAHLSDAGLHRSAIRLSSEYRTRLSQIPDPTRNNQPLLLTLQEMLNERKPQSNSTISTRFQPHY